MIRFNVRQFKRFLLFFVVLFVFLQGVFYFPVKGAVGYEKMEAVSGALGSNLSSARFERLLVEDGLSNSTVLAVLQDQQGFMWFGSADGLNRYDGYEFKVFRHDEKDPSSISNNNIFSLLETRDGTLWVGTDPGGLNRYDCYTGRFTTYQHDPDNPESISNDSVWSLFEDSQGVIWAGTRNGLNAFDRETGKFKSYLADPNVPGSLSNNLVLHITEDHEGVLWVGTRDGLDRFDRQSETFTVYKNDPDDPNSLSNNQVWSVLEDSNNTLWVGTRGGGLNRFDRDTGKFTAIRNQEGSTQGLSDDRIWKLLEDEDGYLWISTERGGLNRMNLQTGQIISFQNNPNDPSSLSSNDLFGIYKDRSGVLWVTSRRVGVNKLNPSLNRFALYRHVPENPDTILVNNVWGILESNDGMVWVGTAGGGLNRFDRAKQSVKVYLADPQNKNSLPINDIYTMYQDEKGLLWIGTQGGGLSMFDPQSEIFTTYKLDPEVSTSIASNFITAIVPAENNKLWLGTLGWGLDLFDPKTGQAVHFQTDPMDVNSLGEGTIYALTLDKNGKLWIGTGRAGADLYDPKLNQFIHFRHDKKNENSLINDVVQAIYVSENGMVWFGTAGGLSGYNPQTNQFSNFNTHNGLPNDSIYGILPDKNGNLWLSTGKGISRFTLGSGEFRNFDISDGLQSNQYNLFSFFESSSGELFFGGPEGLNAFFPDKVTDNPYQPQVIFTDFQLFNRSIKPGDEPLPKSIEQMGLITLKDDQTVFSIQFTADNYQSSVKNLYQYRMTGFDKDWSPPSSNRMATYTNLNPGSYTFEVRAANNDGMWGEATKSIEIKILPPWWQTIWFRVGSILFLVSGLFLAIQLRINTMKRETQHLEERVNQRTAELSQSNLLLQTEIRLREQAEAQLKDANRLLQKQLTEITALRDSLQEQAIRDSLTGLYNRRYLEHELQRELARAQRSEKPISVLMMDIDHFKQLNDTYGHSAGDVVLEKLGEILREKTRSGDFACRYGGEEFVLVQPDNSLETTVHRAEELRKLIACTRIVYKEIELSVTISIGAAAYPDNGTSAELLLDRSDQALYDAKHAGRNCVKVYSPKNSITLPDLSGTNN